MRKEQNLIRAGNEFFSSFKEKVRIIKDLKNTYKNVRIEVDDNGIIFYQYFENCC